MAFEQEALKKYGRLDFMARQIVEGFITGLHKSPFHGFSVEFAEHRLYNQGESTRNIDWKLYARTDKLFVKRFEEETNLRCHIVIDNSSSMHYPVLKKQFPEELNKATFSILASAALMEIMRRQRDAIGLSVYSDDFDAYYPERTSLRHYRSLLSELEKAMEPNKGRQTDTYNVLHHVAEKLHRRSLVLLFTDMLQSDREEEEMFTALKHLKYNKHEVVLFHVHDSNTEIDFNFSNRPLRLVDPETGEELKIKSNDFKKTYQEAMSAYMHNTRLECGRYGIEYVAADIQKGFDEILMTYLLNRRRVSR